MDVQDNNIGTIPDHTSLSPLSPEEMTAVLSASPAGICLLNGRTIQWGNPRFYEMVGQPAGSLEGEDASVLYPSPREFLRVGRSVAEKVAAQGTAMADTRLLRGGKTAFDCRVWASRTVPHDPESPLVLVMTDITQVKSRQTRNQQAQKMEAISVLAGGISHDFNNILMGIQGYLSLMRINLDSPAELSAHLTGVARLVETAADLTSRLLGFARGGKYQIAVLDINQVVAMALNVFKPAHKEIEIQEEFTNSPLPVDGDYSQLEQVILNLLVNGAQAMADSGTITVTTQRTEVGEDHGFHFEVSPGAYARILIRDEGIGMDEETQQKIFDPFFSTKKVGNQKGRGLGLSTVFGIVKNHGGFITVASRKGDGALFNVNLPLSHRPSEKSEDGEESRNLLDKLPKGTETILIVDDEEDILNLGKEFLKKLGYKTLLAANGLEALELFKQRRDEIALVVLDLIMPVMDGKQTFFELRKIRPDIKVLVSTGFHVDEDVEALLEQGCYGFLQKPFSMHKFSGTIREVLDRAV